MATIALSLAGAAIGGIFGPVGALVGRALGAVAGNVIDQKLFGPGPQRVEGPRLTTTDIQTSTEGAAIGRLFGRARSPCQIIWATRYEEEIVTTKSGGSGKGGGSATVVTTEYVYYANFALGLCEGPIAGIGRIWADGKEIDQSLYTFRVYLGAETQEGDPLIEAKEEGNAPAYRGLAYVVFERLPIAAWGNRIPQFSVEVFRPVGDLEQAIRGVALIPGNEFGLEPELVKQTSSTGGEAENRHTLVAATDWQASIDALQMLAPNVASVLLVVTWFGDDLRCDQCTIRPKVDSDDKTTTPYSWAVAGLTRSTATVVSLVNSAPSSGGTPNDATIIRAIQDLTNRGIAVTLLPFVIMDIPAGNGLTDPYDAAEQAAYPWRGRITLSVAPGEPGSPDKTGDAATEVAAFMGTAEAADFGGSGTTVTYSGPAEWRYRRFILHMAQLADLAGGVEAFLIGSEMVGLTRVRSDATTYPFVDGLVDLAAEARAILGAGVNIGYAADWSEWNNHRPADGSGDVLFNLDPLWSDAEIDFVGIDVYIPLADWRDGSSHLDYDPAGPTSIYDGDYLEGNVAGGEYYDFYYADQAARDAQTRTAIDDTDPADEDWVFRQKDLAGWWANAHHDRPAGVRSGTPTAWTAESKPIRFVELGCPAIDKGANQPNVFVDPKSAESAYPYYSNRARDDAMQRAWLEAMLGFYGDGANNPTSTVYAGPMVDLGHSHVWSWDARPSPSFPQDAAWGDADNWETGHWISGRLGAAPARETIAAILDGAGFAAAQIEPVPGVVDGVTAGDLGSARQLLEALQPAYQFDAVESGGVIHFIARLGRLPVASVALDDLAMVDDDAASLYRRTRAQETELPDTLKLRFGDPIRDDQPGSAEARRSVGASLRTVEYAPPVVMPATRGRAIAEIELHAAWVGRERATFALPPSLLKLDPGDVIDFAPAGKPIRIASMGDGGARIVEAFQVDPLSYAPVEMPRGPGRQVSPPVLLDPVAVFVDGAMLTDDALDHPGYLGAVNAPFRGLAAWRSPSTSGYVLDTVLPTPATIGETTADLYPGPEGRWDRANQVYVDLLRGSLSSAEELQVLNGANVLMIENQDGEWEYLQFATATPNGARSYILSDLLRGQRGTEHAMRAPVPAGARVLLVNGSLRQPAIPTELVGVALNWRVGPANLDIGAEGFVDSTRTIEAKGRRPLAPTHLSGVWATNGDVLLTWVRRTRIGGDYWDQEEVPLGEDAEEYEIEILDAGVPVRTVTGLAQPQYLYTAAEQTADFGDTLTEVTFAAYQKNTVFGRGAAGSGTTFELRRSP